MREKHSTKSDELYHKVDIAALLLVGMVYHLTNKKPVTISTKLRADVFTFQALSLINSVRYQTLDI